MPDTEDREFKDLEVAVSGALTGAGATAAAFLHSPWWALASVASLAVGAQAGLRYRRARHALLPFTDQARDFLRKARKEGRAECRVPFGMMRALVRITGLTPEAELPVRTRISCAACGSAIPERWAETLILESRRLESLPDATLASSEDRCPSCGGGEALFRHARLAGKDMEEDPLTVVETFGFQPLIWGSLLILVSAIMPGMERDLTGEVVACYVAIGLGGVFLVSHECRRRTRRTALLFRGDDVEIHRKGRLDHVVRREDIVVYALQGSNTAKILVGLCLWMSLFGTLVLMAGTVRERLLASAGALAFGAAMASVVRTRIRCDYYCVPRKNGRMELVLLPRRARSIASRTSGPSPDVKPLGP